jgi:hypothetical protein
MKHAALNRGCRFLAVFHWPFACKDASLEWEHTLAGGNNAEDL